MIEVGSGVMLGKQAKPVDKSCLTKRMLSQFRKRKWEMDGWESKEENSSQRERTRVHTVTGRCRGQASCPRQVERTSDEGGEAESRREEDTTRL